MSNHRHGRIYSLQRNLTTYWDTVFLGSPLITEGSLLVVGCSMGVCLPCVSLWNCYAYTSLVFFALTLRVLLQVYTAWYSAKTRESLDRFPENFVNIAPSSPELWLTLLAGTESSKIWFLSSQFSMSKCQGHLDSLSCLTGLWIVSRKGNEEIYVPHYLCPIFQGSQACTTFCSVSRKFHIFFVVSSCLWCRVLLLFLLHG